MSEEITTINKDNTETKEDLKTSQDGVIASEKENDLESQSNYDDDYDYDINDNGNNEDDDEEKLFVTDAKKTKEVVSSATSDDDEENSNSKTDSDVKVSKENSDNKPLVKPESELKDDEQTAIATLDLSQSLEEKKLILSQLHENVDYAIILAFLEKFASHLSLKDLTFATLESYFTATKTIPRKLIDLHLKLMKNLPMGKHAKKDKWDYYLAKFVKRFSAKEAQLIEESAYLTCDVGFKVTCLKNLLETQFDENAKFKQILAEQITDPSFLREQPLGRDKDGLCYMCYIDKEFAVRLFAYDARISNDAAKTWRLVCMELNALKEFVIKLNEEPELSALRTCKRYLANLAKEEKILKQKQKEAEIATEENSLTESKTTLVKEEVMAKIEETEIKGEKINASSDEIKGEPEAAVKIEIKPEETEIEKKEELEENKQEAKEEPVAVEEIKEKDPVSEEFDTPIALRKSTRSSSRRGAESSQLVVKPVVTPKKATTAPKPVQQVENPKSTPKKPTKSKSKRSKSKKDSSCSSESELEISDDEDEVESKCVKCNKVKARQILLLCDGCDAAHHLTCLKPVLNEVPEGDWFCGICEHDKLIKKLQEKIELIDNHFKELELAKLKSIKKRTNRIADIGANLDSLFGAKKKKKTYEKNEDNDSENSGDENDENGERKSRKRRTDEVNNGKSFSIFNSNEPLGQRSCRAKTRINYTFDDYDRTIKEAVGENVDGEDFELPKDEVKGTRRSLRNKSSKFDSNGNTDNEENEDDKASVKSGSSAEFKVKIKKKYSDDDDDDEEEENEDVSNSDEDKSVESDQEFRPKSAKTKKKTSKRNSRSGKSSKRRGGRRSGGRKRRSTSNKYHSDDDDDLDDDEKSELTETEDEVEFMEMNEVKRSSRNRKCITENYCEFDEMSDEEDEEEKEEKKVRKSTKRKKYEDDDDFILDQGSEEENFVKNRYNNRYNRHDGYFKRKKEVKVSYKEDDDDDYTKYDENGEDAEEEDEKCLDFNKANHRQTESSLKKKSPPAKTLSRIKKPWTDSDEEEGGIDSDSDDETRNKKKKIKQTKSVIKKPWNESDEETQEDEENSVTEKENTDRDSNSEDGVESDKVKEPKQNEIKSNSNVDVIFEKKSEIKENSNAEKAIEEKTIATSKKEIELERKDVIGKANNESNIEKVSNESIKVIETSEKPEEQMTNNEVKNTESILIEKQNQINNKDKVLENTETTEDESVVPIPNDNVKTLNEETLKEKKNENESNVIKTSSSSETEKETKAKLKKSKSKDELATKPTKGLKVSKSKKLSLENATSTQNVPTPQAESKTNLTANPSAIQQTTQFQPALSSYVNTMTSPFNLAGYQNFQQTQPNQVHLSPQFQSLSVSSFLSQSPQLTMLTPPQQQQQSPTFVQYPQTIQFQPQIQHYGQILQPAPQQQQQQIQFPQFYQPQAQLQLQPKPAEYTNMMNGVAFPQNMNGPQVYMNPQQMFIYQNYYQQQQQQQQQHIQIQHQQIQPIIQLQQASLNQKFTLPPGNT